MVSRLLQARKKEGGRTRRTDRGPASGPPSGNCIFPAPARAERNFSILLTETDHVAEDRSTLITVDGSDEEKIRCQSVAFEHETANTVELGAVVPYQLSVVRAVQKFARVKFLTPKELLRNQLSFFCH